MADMRLIWDFLLNLFGNIWVLYTSSFILASVIALWLLRKVVNFFRLLL